MKTHIAILAAIIIAVCGLVAWSMRQLGKVKIEKNASK